jgi:hypothetical protein
MRDRRPPSPECPLSIFVSFMVLAFALYQPRRTRRYTKDANKIITTLLSCVFLNTPRPQFSLPMIGATVLAWRAYVYISRHRSFQIRGPILLKKLSLGVTILLFVLTGVSLAQKLTQLVHPAPDGAIVEYLLTDGTVMVQGGTCSDWWRLTPNSSGSYVKGTWKQPPACLLDTLPTPQRGLYWPMVGCW